MDFEKIIIGYDNEQITLYSDLYYYSQTEPADDGFYWHYDVDGVTPVVWATRKENE